MLIALLKAMLGMAVVLGAWLAVQRLFCASLPGASADEDALAGRTGCHGCNCETPCENDGQARSIAQDSN
jgi:hypothetical protein